IKKRKTTTILNKRGPLSLPTGAEEAAPTKRVHVSMQAAAARRALPEAMASRAFTFADLFLDRSRFKHLKLPPWLFPITYQRKDQASLTPCEQQRFLCALNVLIANGTYGKLVDVHAEMHMQHTNDRLLPWHRIFLLQLENALRLIHPDVSIPYWDWTQAGEESIPPWLATVLPVVPT